ncbi:type I restriction enzyme, S subunit [Enterococcus sp. DIV0840]|uniref:restriction endonuclease subunit S n=1 Tax=unclassified Enterococcus TaxID=2608891 RepID=UPI001A908D86|nr:restriction endonuclease subunit S [Enterococcus sp. DIV0849a]MBO0434009.1 restriction endonuclease subunit S [Enterococcus sp. DIV0849a]
MNIQPLKKLLISLETGKRPKGGAQGKGVPSLGAEHLNNYGGFNLKIEKMKYIPSDYFSKMQKGRIKKGDILLVKDGATTGKVSMVSNDFPFEDASINEHLFLLRCDQQIILPRFLFYYLYSSYGKLEILKDFRGATIGGISRKFSEMKIFYPSMDIQKRIVDTLDNAQSLIEKRKEQLTEMDRLIQSVFYEMFGTSFSTKSNWKTKKVGQIFTVKSGSTPSRNEKRYWEKGTIPWIKTNEVKNNVIFSSEEKITVSGKENSSVILFPKNTILIAMYGQGKTRGRSAILGIEATTNQACAGLLPTDNVNTLFIWHQLMQRYNELRALGRGGNQPNLNAGLIKDFNLIVPPVELQNKFATIVEEIESQKKVMEQSLIEMENNFNALLQKAFKGELFPE